MEDYGTGGAASPLTLWWYGSDGLVRPVRYLLGLLVWPIMAVRELVADDAMNTWAGWQLVTHLQTGVGAPIGAAMLLYLSSQPLWAVAVLPLVLYLVLGALFDRVYADEWGSYPHGVGFL